MSTIIEQDGIRVEADTEALALKALKAEQRKARKEREQRAADEAIAEDKAKLSAFRMLSRIVAGENMPAGWNIGRKYSSTKWQRNSSGCFLLTMGDYGTPKAERLFHVHDILGVVDDASGEPICIFVFEFSGDNEARAYAIGCHNGMIGFVPLPETISPSLFDRTEAIA